MEKNDKRSSVAIAAAYAAVAVLSGIDTAALAEPSAPDGALEAAEKAYASSSFDEARVLLDAASDADKKSYRGLLLRGELALLKNRFAEAEHALRRAIAAEPASKPPKLLLAEALVRQDRYAAAAPLYAAAGLAERATQAAALGPDAYDIQGARQAVRVKADAVEPLMVFSASVNGSAPAHFILDTGGSQLILDKAYAAALGVKAVGQETGEFSGGKKAGVALARIDSFTLEGAGGRLTAKALPVQLLDTRRFSGIFGGLKIDGIIGTQFLYHFRATIDYPRGELVLRRRDSRDEPHRAIVPMWMGGDHYMVAFGSLNGVGPLPFFPDVGLAGLAFTAPPSTLEAARVSMTASDVQGEGGGGQHPVKPIHLDSVGFGPIERRDLEGVAGAFPASLEHGRGYLVAGIVSHAFFKPYAVTFDFRKMQIDLDGS